MDTLARVAAATASCAAATSCDDCAVVDRVVDVVVDPLGDVDERLAPAVDAGEELRGVPQRDHGGGGVEHPLQLVGIRTGVEADIPILQATGIGRADARQWSATAPSVRRNESIAPSSTRRLPVNPGWPTMCRASSRWAARSLAASFVR